MRARPLSTLIVIAGVACGVAGSVAVTRNHFLAGAALWLLGMILLRWPTSIWSAEPAPPPASRRRRLALLAVCAIAVGFRFYHLEPPGLWGDDALNGLFAFDILDGRVRSPFELVHHSHSYFHALSNYPIAAAFQVFGPGPATLRLPSVIANALAVPLLYATVAPLFGVRTALAAALFFACSSMQLIYARSLIQMNLGGLFQIAGLCLLVRGVTGKRRWLVAAAGVPLALCLYTYHSAKLAPLVAVPYVLAASLSGSPLWKRGVRGDFETDPSKQIPLDPPFAKGEARRVALWGLACLGVFLACALPFLSSWRSSSEQIAARIEGTSIWSGVHAEGWKVVWSSFRRTLLAFHHEQGPQYHWFGLGYEPAFDWVVGFLVLPGLAAALARWREPRHAFLLGWIAIGLLPGILSTEAPRAYRVLLAAPPLYVLAAWTVVRIGDFARALPDRRARIALGATALALLASVPVIDFNWYFFHTSTHPTFRYYQGERIIEMARELRRRGPGWTGYVLSDTFDANHECLRFLARCWGLELRSVAALADVVPVRRVERGALFMMTGSTLGAAEGLSAWYPEERLDVHYDPQPRDSFLDGWLFERLDTPSASNAFFAVSRELAESKRGVRAAFLSAEGAVLATRIEAQPWRGRAPDLPASPGTIRTVRWSATLVTERDGAHRFVAQESGRISVDGVPVDPRGAGQDLELAAGTHLLEAEADPAAPLRLLWRPPGRELGELAPEALFQPPPSGLLSDRVMNGRRLRRFESYPYYGFAVDAVPLPSEIRWFGRLHVPEGGLRLRLEASGSHELRLDGRLWRDTATLSPGIHDLDLRLADQPSRLVLKLGWRRPDGNLDPDRGRGIQAAAVASERFLT